MKKAALSSLLFLVLLTGFSQEAMAQNRVAGFIKDVAKDVFVNPTTYGSLGASLLGKGLDWDSSQIFFEHGHGETNPDYAVNGPGSKAVSHAAGNRRLVVESFLNFGLSIGNNAVISATERLLLTKHPEHQKLVKTIGWIEKVVANGYIVYFSSYRNFKQWQINKNRAQQLGYK